MFFVPPLLDETPEDYPTVLQPQIAGTYRNNCNEGPKENVTLLDPGTTNGDSGLQGKMMTQAREQCQDLNTHLMFYSHEAMS